MRALVIDRLGSADELHVTDVPIPATITDELLIRVVAAGINPIDAKTRAGSGASAAITAFPVVLGNDFSGVVVKAPYETFPLQPGDAVYGMGRTPRTPGTYAEYVPVSSMSVAKKPANLSFTEAAGVPLAALTAWGMVHTVAQVQPGARVLVHAASGGVGHFAVQFARIAGADVIATGSARNADFLREIGASEVIDYTAQRFDEVLADHKVDVVIDLIGNVHDETGSRSLGIIADGGILVNAPTGSWPTMMTDADAAGVRASTFKVPADARTLEKITALIEAGEVRVNIDEIFDLEEGAAAHRALEGGHTRGKIVLRVSSGA